MKFVLTLISIFFTVSGLASEQSHYCSQTSNAVSIGFNKALVEQRCGQPKSKRKTTIDRYSAATVTTWYYKPRSRSSNPLRLAQYIVVNIVNDRVARIHLPLLAYTAAIEPCFLGDNAIKIGDSSVQLLTQCRQPDHRKTQSDSILVPTEVEEWTYQNDPFQPEKGLYFDGDELVEIRTK